MRMGGTGLTENWRNTRDWIEWRFTVLQPGMFNVTVVTTHQHLEAWSGGHTLRLTCAGQSLRRVRIGPLASVEEFDRIDASKLSKVQVERVRAAVAAESDFRLKKFDQAISDQPLPVMEESHRADRQPHQILTFKKGQKLARARQLMAKTAIYKHAARSGAVE